MKILITGTSGQLGHDVREALNNMNHDILAPTHEEMDITDYKSVSSFFDINKPDVVIHCAAYTAVDKAEVEENLCRKVNVEGTKNIVENCKKDALLIYISTDYVFDGEKDGLWLPTDQTNPINVYGTSKRDGEKIVLGLDRYFIIRTSWVFGINGNNFVKTMLRLSNDKDTINVVCDQIGSPTYTKDLANLIIEMIMSNNYGIYHAHNEGFCSWAEFAEEIFIQTHKKTIVNPITTDKYPVKAKRPKNSKLSTETLITNGFDLLPDWKNALSRYLCELGYNL